LRLFHLCFARLFPSGALPFESTSDLQGEYSLNGQGWVKLPSFFPLTSEHRNHETRKMGSEDCEEFRVERFGLPKSIESGTLSLTKAVIRWMSI
jgi:hypothetical protein